MAKPMNKNDAQVLVENVHNTLRHYELRLNRLIEFEAAYADCGDAGEVAMIKEHNDKVRGDIHQRVAQLYAASRFLLPAVGPEMAASFEGYVGQMCRAHKIAFGSGSPFSKPFEVPAGDGVGQADTQADTKPGQDGRPAEH